MPRDPATNAMLRDRVRAEFALPFADPILAEAEFADDTPEETISRFRQAGVAPTRAAAAKAARAAEEEAKQQLLSRPGGAIGINVGTLVTGSSFLAGASSIVPFRAFTIEAVTLFIPSTTAPGAGATSGAWALLVSPTSDLSLAQVQSDINTNVAGTLFADGVKSNQYSVRNDGEVHITVPISFPVTFSPAHIKVLVSTPGGVSLPVAVVTVSELTLPAVAGTSFAPTGGRISINLNTGATRTRGRQRSTPRAAVISVTQGGRIINQRTVAWQSLAGPIRADWFNRQVGGQGDPNIRWIP